MGSGFILHPSGYIVANAHGVERQIDNVVALSDGKSYPAELVACAHDQDLALMKIDAGRPLKAVRLGRSGDVMIGETVVVIANPHGLMRTCTTGVVSAIGRTSHLADVPGVTLQGLIQSDAGINPGSSGGPWFNVAGEVIGVTSSMKRDAQNVAFAISAASLRKAIPAMLNVQRRYGFVTGLDVAAEGPCQVTAVQGDSPAARAKLAVGDVIVKLAGIATASVADYHLALIGRKAGESLLLEWIRAGKPCQGVLVLAPRPKPEGALLLKQRLGLSVAALDNAKVKAMGLRSNRGFVITAVDAKAYEKVEHKPAPGDVLARIDSIRPRDLDQVAFLLENHPSGHAIQLVILRHKDNLSVRLDMNLVLP